MQNYDELREFVISGKKQQVADLVRQHLDDGTSAKDIMDNGLIPGMAVVGKKFQEGEYFIPEMLMAARALNAGLEVLRPLLEASDVKPVAKVLVGTVKGDIHDIGKNLVSVMLRGGGFEVIDAGVDVPPGKFVDMARESGAEIVGLSALLTTTMPAMKDTIEAFQADGSRDNVKIMIGGAPITQEYADEIGADGFARNAAFAVDLAKKLLGVAA